MQKMEMRRKDRQLTEKEEITDVIESCQIMHVGMVDDGEPYVVALSFGYEMEKDALVLYFHSANAGRMLGIMQKNPNVFIQMHSVDELIRGSSQNPCSYSWKFDSVMGKGVVSFVDDTQEKSRILNNIIHHLDKSTDETFQFPQIMLEKINVGKILVQEYTAKRRV